MYKWEESTPFCLRLESRVDEAGGMEGDQFVTVGTMMSSYKLLKLKKNHLFIVYIHMGFGVSGTPYISGNRRNWKV